MEINNLKAQIKSGRFDPYYIFCGEEHYILKEYIKMIAEKSGLKIVYADSLGDVFAKITQKSLLKSPYLYVIIDDKDFLTNEKAWDALGDGGDFKDDKVIFYYTSVDKRIKFWKHFQVPVVEFAPLENRILIKYIQKEINLSVENCEILIEVCEGDLSRILLEIDKIKKYVNYLGPAETQNGVFDKFLKEGTIYKAPKDAIFDFVNAVLERDTEKTWDLLEQSYAVGEANMVLLSVLYNNVKTLLQVQSCKSTKNLGLNGWAVKNVSAYKDNYSNGELVKFMRLIREAEKGIKTGVIADEISVESILVQVM